MLGLPRTEIIQANYSYISAQPIRDALELLEKGRYNDEKIYMLFGIHPSVLDEYPVSMSEYRDDHSILNDGWH
jgi:hypothetical protein